MSRRHSYSNIHQLFLTLANGSSDKQLLQYLQKGDVNITGPGGDNLLIRSIKVCNLGRTDLLLKYKCDVNKVNDAGESPLYLAVCSKDTILCQKLIQAGALINSEDTEKPALINAVLRSDYETVELLMANGADCNAASLSGETPWSLQTALMLALNQTGSDTMVDILMSYGNVNLDKQLSLSYESKFEIGMHFFLAKGGNPFKRGNNNNELSVAEKVLYGLMYPKNEKRFKYYDWCINQLIMEYGHVTEFSHRNCLLILLSNCETMKILMKTKGKPVRRLTQNRLLEMGTGYFSVVSKLLDHFLELGLFITQSDNLKNTENAFGCGVTECLICGKIREELTKRILCEPPSLFNQCKSSIRCLWDFGVSDKVRQLSLPSRMKDMLCFSDVDYVEF